MLNEAIIWWIMTYALYNVLNPMFLAQGFSMRIHLDGYVEYAMACILTVVKVHI